MQGLTSVNIGSNQVLATNISCVTVLVFPAKTVLQKRVWGKKGTMFM